MIRVNHIILKDFLEYGFIFLILSNDGFGSNTVAQIGYKNDG
jgi:hypothetical protein